jgi:excisionase family DNA binding protein
MEKLLVTRHEAAAAALGLSLRGVDYLLAQGKLATRKIGRRRLIPRTELERFARSDCDRIAPAPEAVNGR